MSRGAPVLAAMSLNRREPRNSSRITSSDHFSPTTSSADAIEQRRGVAVRAVAGVTGTASHTELANPTHSVMVAPGGLEIPTHVAEDRHDRTPDGPAGPDRRRTGGVQARPAGAPLRRARVPAGDQGRRASAAADRRAARVRDP